MPHALEALVIAEFGDFWPFLEERLAPAHEGLFIICAKQFVGSQLQTLLLDMVGEHFGGGQQAAGENVTLDEVYIFAIGLEALIVDEDGLNNGSAAGLEVLLICWK